MHTALQYLIVALACVDGTIQILRYVHIHFQRGDRTTPETRTIGQIETFDGYAILPPTDFRWWITRTGVTDQFGTYARHQILGSYADFHRLWRD